MKKVLALVVLALLATGGYVHYHNWLDQSNQIKTHLEELASGKNERLRVTYDKIDVAGYPFRHEVVLNNPCFYFLQVDPNSNLSVFEGCLKGDMLLSYHPFKSDKKLFIETVGELTVTLPPEKNAESNHFLVVGKLKQEFDFDDAYEYAKSSDLFYFLENLRQANLVATGLTLKSIEGQSKVFVEDLNGSLDYTRKPYDDDFQKIQLSVDYSALFADPLQNYQSPFDTFFTNLNGQIKSFNQKSGLNKGRYDINAIIPSSAILRQSLEKISRSFSFDDIPDFSLDFTQNAKNNFFTNKTTLSTVWKRGKDNSLHYKFKNNGVQDISKEGVEEFSNLLQDFAQEIVKSMVDSATENHETVSKALNSAQFEDLFKGMPQHFELDVNLDFNKTQKDGHEKISVNVNPFSIDTDKGAVILNVDYESDKPFKASLEFGSLVRIVDGFITRYNILARVVDHGTRLPVITEHERDELLEILKKYSDNPEKLTKNVKFTLTQGDNQELLIGQHNIYGLVGELGFFFQHLQQKLQPAAKEQK